MPPIISLADLDGLVGKEVGVSEWIEVDQKTIDLFADATHDHQFIHVDPERAKAETPFGGTIAHGFLSLSLLSKMNYDCLPHVKEQRMGINYGFNKIRFLTPVRSGWHVRGRFVLKERRYRGQDMVMLTHGVSVEIKEEKKPAITAEWLTIIRFDPEDHPEKQKQEAG
ncbi:MaoC family dehydratase [Hoeflea prorocentri]|uniref:MaoC family dehydratase n=1 Tax=Hoeflea prorocentri TaxID=1922333 RepID=A0A9X3ZFZ3_9HYPH|nr:MaoC family dehydratase [Hoeflea prorocentri]MCY6379214.1 MaoC family dehydratase [Hoeflea prorocentri]MDA5397015.1 MaoC family dehydratase [Hoeflea prorocentri]